MGFQIWVRTFGWFSVIWSVQGIYLDRSHHLFFIRKDLFFCICAHPLLSYHLIYVPWLKLGTYLRESKFEYDRWQRPRPPGWRGSPGPGPRATPGPIAAPARTPPCRRSAGSSASWGGQWKSEELTGIDRENQQEIKKKGREQLFSFFLQYEEEIIYSY